MSGVDDPRSELRERVRTDEPPPDDAVVALRGGPDTRSLIATHARRVHRLFVLDGGDVWGISVFVALDPSGPASDEGLLRGRLLSYEKVYLPTVGALRAAGFELLPTFGRPHFTVLMAGPEHADTLFEALGALRDNPYSVGRGGAPA